MRSADRSPTAIRLKRARMTRSELRDETGYALPTVDRWCLPVKEGKSPQSEPPDITQHELEARAKAIEAAIKATPFTRIKRPRQSPP